MNLLVFLARNAGKVMSRETIVDRVWQVEAVAVGTLTHAIAELRKAFGDDAKNPSYIETIPKRGYRLLVEPVPASEETTEPADEQVSPTVAPRSGPPIGDTISHYRILEHLGGGGMGVVYMAEDLKLERTVALKFLPPEWSRDPDARVRFIREARAASTLDHPNICTIHEIDETDEGRLFIAMAYYEGDTLKQRIERGALQIDDAVDLAIQMAEGLQRAHEAGIVHRDVKPANVIITERGETKIVDFGLAKLAGEFGLTQTGSTMGTPHYMSPEQARGDDVGPGTDIWSLGVVIHEMVSGVKSFRGESGDAVVHSILHEQPLPLRELRPDTPQMLERIVTRTLEKDAERRYASVKELLSDLRALRLNMTEAHLETTALRVGSKRRWLRIAPPVVGALLLVVVAMLLWRARQEAPPEPTHEGPKRIVVLPFLNLGSPEDEYFADGMSVELINRLAAVSGLHVISTTTAMRYKGSQKSIPEIGRELGVEYALEGEVRWEPGGEGKGRVRISPQLVLIAEDRHIWRDQFDREIESIFAVQSDIARRVADQLEVALLEPERVALDARPTDNMEAYSAYLYGLDQLEVFAPETVRVARAMFERAVELDPDFALAHAVLSQIHSMAFAFRFDLDPERMAKAKRAADRALELDPNVPEVHVALGMFHNFSGDSDRALAEYHAALTLRPNDADALEQMALVQRSRGQWQKAVDLLRRAVELDPKNAFPLASLASTYWKLRRYPEAEDTMDRAIAIAPDRGDLYLVKGMIDWSWRGPSHAREVIQKAAEISPEMAGMICLLEFEERNYDSARTCFDRFSQQVSPRSPMYLPIAFFDSECSNRMGMPDLARQRLEQARGVLEHAAGARPEDATIRSWLGLVYAGLGRKEDAIREGERAVALQPISESADLGPTHLTTLATIYNYVGEFEAALDTLEQVLSIPGEISVTWLQGATYDSLRDHPRFAEIIEEYEQRE
jgi:TolB-like protein/Tfp pilus assembly protein PilF